MTHEHKCKFTALYAPRGENEHAHQCLTCEDIILVGGSHECDRNPGTHRKVGTPPTRVVHCKREKFDVYIGRPSKWGNPFALKPTAHAAEFVASRDEALRRYEEWVRSQPSLMAALGELRGKTLGCWCKPKPCHGDILARLSYEVST